MNKAISLAMLSAGIALVIFGFVAMDSISSTFSEFCSGTPSDRSIWLLITGVALISISGFYLYRGPKVIV